VNAPSLRELAEFPNGRHNEAAKQGSTEVKKEFGRRGNLENQEIKKLNVSGGKTPRGEELLFFGWSVTSLLL
jgi:hypothetical protein